MKCPICESQKLILVNFQIDYTEIGSLMAPRIMNARVECLPCELHFDFETRKEEAMKVILSLARAQKLCK